MASARAAASGTPSTANASATCAPTVNVGFSARLGSWYTMDTSRAHSRRKPLADSAATSWPAIDTAPPVIRPPRGNARKAASAAVDLPQPDSPTRPKHSPAPTSKETPRRIGTLP